jgi:hypothetical protein
MTENSIVRQIDHLMIETNDPGKLFDLFSETLGLPEAWPLRSFGTFTSGGVCAGNVNLEFIRFDTFRFGGPIDAKDKLEGARLIGVAFEPNKITSDSIAELEKRDLKHGLPQATPNWTNTQILGLLDKPGLAFLCEYHFDQLGWRKILSDKIIARNGGMLGLRSVSEVIVETNAPESWHRLLSATTEASSFQLGAGPSIRFTKGARNSLLSIRCEVSSIADARIALEKLSLLGSDGNILASAVGGLNIEFIQNKGE